MPFCCGDDEPLMQAELVLDKLIGVHGFQPVGVEYRLWKVTEVEGDNDLCATADGCSECMPVVGIGKRESIDQSFVTCHQAVRQAWFIRVRVRAR